MTTIHRIIVVQLQSLSKVAKVKQGMHCNDHTCRCRACDYCDEGPLNISLHPPSHLFEVRDPLSEMSIPNSQLKNRKVEVQFFGPKDVDSPANDVIPYLLVPFMEWFQG